jgi:hypothetical protein
LLDRLQVRDERVRTYLDFLIGFTTAHATALHVIMLAQPSTTRAVSTALRRAPRGVRNEAVGWDDPGMRLRLRTYTAYSVGCAFVWAVILVIAASAGTNQTLHTLLLVFGGWVIGWTSATIARYVYPPPRSRQPN